MLQETTDIGRLVTIEVKVRVGLVSIPAECISVQKVQRNKRIEEIAGSAVMESESLLQDFEVQCPAGECREDAELDRAEECPGSPKAIAHLQDVVRPYRGSDRKLVYNGRAMLGEPRVSARLSVTTSSRLSLLSLAMLGISPS